MAARTLLLAPCRRHVRPLSKDPPPMGSKLVDLPSIGSSLHRGNGSAGGSRVLLRQRRPSFLNELPTRKISPGYLRPSQWVVVLKDGDDDRPRRGHHRHRLNKAWRAEWTLSWFRRRPRTNEFNPVGSPAPILPWDWFQTP